MLLIIVDMVGFLAFQQNEKYGGTTMRRTPRWLAYTVLGVVTAVIWCYVLIEYSVLPPTGEICHKNEYSSQKDCASYHIALVAAWYVAKFLDLSAAPITAIATILLVLFTFRLWWSTDKLATITSALHLRAKTQEVHTQVIERAYVKMSHAPPGITIDTTWLCLMHIGVKNFGKTPATVTKLLITWRDTGNNEQLPDPPNYEEGNNVMAITPNAFLVENDEFFYPYHFFVGEQPTVNAVMAGERLLHVFGYIEYIDAFGNEHVAGYGRTYRRELDDKTRYTDDGFKGRNNLVFIHESGYNYDRPRRITSKH